MKLLVPVFAPTENSATEWDANGIEVLQICRGFACELCGVTALLQCRSLQRLDKGLRWLSPWFVERRLFTGPDRQYRAGGRTYHAFGDTSHDQAAETRAPRRRHHNQINLFGFSRVDDLAARGSHGDESHHLDVTRCSLGNQLGQLLGGLTLQILQEFWPCCVHGWRNGPCDGIGRRRRELHHMENGQFGAKRACQLKRRDDRVLRILREIGRGQDMPELHRSTSFCRSPLSKRIGLASRLSQKIRRRGNRP